MNFSEVAGETRGAGGADEAVSLTEGTIDFVDYGGVASLEPDRIDPLAESCVKSPKADVDIPEDGGQRVARNPVDPDAIPVEIGEVASGRPPETKEGDDNDAEVALQQVDPVTASMLGSGALKTAVERAGRDNPVRREDKRTVTAPVASSGGKVPQVPPPRGGSTSKGAPGVAAGASGAGKSGAGQPPRGGGGDGKVGGSSGEDDGDEGANSDDESSERHTVAETPPAIEHHPFIGVVSRVNREDFPVDSRELTASQLQRRLKDLPINGMLRFPDDEHEEVAEGAVATFEDIPGDTAGRSEFSRHGVRFGRLRTDGREDRVAVKPFALPEGEEDQQLALLAHEYVGSQLLHREPRQEGQPHGLDVLGFTKLMGPNVHTGEPEIQAGLITRNDPEVISFDVIAGQVRNPDPEGRVLDLARRAGAAIGYMHRNGMLLDGETTLSSFALKGGDTYCTDLEYITPLDPDVPPTDLRIHIIAEDIGTFLEGMDTSIGAYREDVVEAFYDAYSRQAFAEDSRVPESARFRLSALTGHEEGSVVHDPDNPHEMSPDVPIEGRTTMIGYEDLLIAEGSIYSYRLASRLRELGLGDVLMLDVGDEAHLGGQAVRFVDNPRHAAGRSSTGRHAVRFGTMTIGSEDNPSETIAVAVKPFFGENDYDHHGDAISIISACYAATITLEELAGEPNAPSPLTIRGFWSYMQDNPEGDLRLKSTAIITENDPDVISYESYILGTETATPKERMNRAMQCAVAAGKALGFLHSHRISHGGDYTAGNIAFNRNNPERTYLTDLEGVVAFDDSIRREQSVPETVLADLYTFTEDLDIWRDLLPNLSMAPLMEAFYNTYAGIAHTAESGLRPEERSSYQVVLEHTYLDDN